MKKRTVWLNVNVEKEMTVSSQNKIYRKRLLDLTLLLCRRLIDGCHCEPFDCAQDKLREAIREASRGCQRRPWRSQVDCFGIKSLATTTSDCHGHSPLTRGQARPPAARVYTCESRCGLAMTTPQITCDRLLLIIGGNFKWWNNQEDNSLNHASIWQSQGLVLPLPAYAPDVKKPEEQLKPLWILNLLIWDYTEAESWKKEENSFGT